MFIHTTKLLGASQNTFFGWNGKIYNTAIKNGAIGGKLLGAGGGGFFLFYVPHFKQKYFIKNFKKMVTIPFNFTSERSSILFKNFTK